MKLNRLIYNAEISLRYFYSKSFTIDNFKFLDLNLSIPPIEKDDFSLTEKMFSNKDLYSNTYKLILKIAFGESENDLKFAKLRYLIVYYVTKTFHAFIIFFVWKILYKYLFEWSINFSKQKAVCVLLVLNNNQFVTFCIFRIIRCLWPFWLQFAFVMNIKGKKTRELVSVLINCWFDEAYRMISEKNLFNEVKVIKV